MIRIGDVIRLRPSIFEKEFQTNNWSNKYLYEDKFEFVSLRFMNLRQEGDSAKTFFGSSETKVEEIELDSKGQPFILWTGNFRILYPKALEHNEINILPFETTSFRLIKSEKELIDNLEFFEQKYIEGLFSVLERENNKLDQYKLGLTMMIREGKWKNDR